MCEKIMEKYQGDLTDILRASTSSSSSGGSYLSSLSASRRDYQFPCNQIQIDNYPSGRQIHEEPSLDEFGLPFSDIGDPLLLHDDEIDHHIPTSAFLDTTVTANYPSSDVNIKSDINTPENTGGLFSSGGCNYTSLLNNQRIVNDDHHHGITRTSSNNNNNNNNIFSRMVQISPNSKLQQQLPVSPCGSQVVVAAASPRRLKKQPPTLICTNEMINGTVNNSKVSLMENASVQISSPRSTGMKRRKSQAKKVVCIPAPAPANSRSSGEIVPSDLWAWRKYGQKPIKGSPYPRGYYRCSSSKGCSARKQVERSRTDPNMLVITYTSEHNHPWPTQRNALAGSTRSQPAAKSCSNLKKTSSQPGQKADCQTDNASLSPIVAGSSGTGQVVKEEMEDLDKEMEMDDFDQFNEGFPQSYKPALPDSNQPEDFFADLGELEADPLNLFFAQGLSGDVERESKNLDPFSFYDWTSDSTTSTNTTTTITASSIQAKKGLWEETD